MAGDLLPEADELIVRALRSTLADVHTAAPATVVSYDPATKVAQVQLGFKRPIFDDDGEIIEEEIPPFAARVLFPGSSRFSINFEIEAGDGVLLIFPEHSTAEWLNSGKPSVPGDLKKHGFGSAIALPGFDPKTATKSETDNSIGVPGGLRVKFGTGAVEVGGGAAPVANADKTDSELGAIATAISSLGGTYVPSGSVASTNLKAD
jgi:hypothetical protein